MSPSPQGTEKGSENEKCSSTKNYQQLCVAYDYGLMLLSVDVWSALVACRILHPASLLVFFPF
jgi:hypothetical protein